MFSHLIQGIQQRQTIHPNSTSKQIYEIKKQNKYNHLNERKQKKKKDKKYC